MIECLSVYNLLGLVEDDADTFGIVFAIIEK